MAAPRDVRQALIQRVSRKVSGHGIARRSIEGAVDRVLAALPADMAPRTRAPVVDGAARPSASSRPPIVAVLSAASVPDLASRARHLLAREGHRVLASGAGAAGRHTVLTVKLAAGAESALERASRELGASLTVLEPSAAQQVSA